MILDQFGSQAQTAPSTGSKVQDLATGGPASSARSMASIWPRGAHAPATAPLVLDGM